MTTNNHTPLSTSAKVPATGLLFNTVFGELDAAIGDLTGLSTAQKSTLVAAINEVRNNVASISGIASGVVSTTVNQPSGLSSGATEIIVDDVTGFVEDAYIVYVSTTGTTEYNLISSVNSGESKLLLDSATGFDIADGALLAMITLEDKLSAGNYPTQSQRMAGQDALPGAARLSAAVSASATSIVFRQASDLKPGMWIALSPFTSSCEVRKVAAFAGLTATVAAVSGTHAADSAVVLLHEPVFSAALWGAKGDGSTNDATAINAGFTKINAAGGGVLVLNGGTFVVGSSVVMKQNTTLRMARGTVLTTTADVNLIEMDKETAIEGGGGSLYVNNASYTKAAIYLAGSKQIAFHSGDSLRVENLNIDCVNQAGNGIHIYCHGDNTFDYVTGATFDQVQITRFEYGIRIQCIEGGNTCFANDNRFSNCWLSYSEYPISLEGGATEPNAVNVNAFSNFSIQTSAATILPIYVEGARNTFANLAVWDFPGGDPVIHLSAASAGNRLSSMQVDQYAILDEGARNTIESTLFSVDSLGRMSDTAAAGLTHAHYGEHDNQLAFANDEMTISQTAGSAATSGSWANVFGGNLDSLIQWGPSGPPTLPITVEVTFGFNIYGVTGVGITFVTPHVPGGVKIELYDSGGAAWNTIYDTTGHETQMRNLYVPVIQIDDGYLYRAKPYSKLRFTIKSLGSAATAVAISNIVLHSSHYSGRRWLSRKSPSFLTDVTIPKTLVINSTSSDLIQAKQSGDAYPRFILTNAGQVWLGSGSAAAVAMLYRASDTELRVPDGVTTHAGNGAYNGGHLQMGNYHLWVDATGDLRIKSSAPSSDTDGTVVGTQS